MAETPAGRPEGLYELRLLFDSRDARQVRRAALIHALDVWHEVELIDLAAAPPGPAASEAVQPAAGLPPRPVAGGSRLRLVTGREDVLTGYALFAQLVRRLRLLWPLALLTWLPGVARLGRAWYPGEAQDPAPSAGAREEGPAPGAAKSSDPLRARDPARG